jgi:hypothetical protein
MKMSTILIAAMTAAYLVYLVLRFLGVAGHSKGEIPAGMAGMFVLLVVLLVADLQRNRRNPDLSDG